MCSCSFCWGVSPALRGHHFVVASATGSCEKNVPFVRRWSVAPLPPIYIQSWHAHFYQAGGAFNIEAGGEGAAGIEERFFRTTRGPKKERFFRTRSEEN